MRLVAYPGRHEDLGQPQVDLQVIRVTKHSRTLVVFLASLSFLGLVSQTQAGTFCAPTGCLLATPDTSRVVDQFAIYDIHDFGPFCGMEIDPYTINGSPMAPVLDFALPPGLHGQIDPETGVGMIRPDSCVTTLVWVIHDVSLVTDVRGACFRTFYLGPDDQVLKGQTLCFSTACASATPTRPETWGSLKATYR
jgi:hypothetical protein